MAVDIGKFNAPKCLVYRPNLGITFRPLDSEVREQLLCGKTDIQNLVDSS